MLLQIIHSLERREKKRKKLIHVVLIFKWFFSSFSIRVDRFFFLFLFFWLNLRAAITQPNNYVYWWKLDDISETYCCVFWRVQPFEIDWQTKLFISPIQVGVGGHISSRWTWNFEKFPSNSILSCISNQAHDKRSMIMGFLRCRQIKVKRDIVQTFG